MHVLNCQNTEKINGSSTSKQKSGDQPASAQIVIAEYYKASIAILFSLMRALLPARVLRK